MAGRGCGSKNKWPAGWARARLLCRSARNNRGRRASVSPAADTQQTHSGDIPQSSASTCLFAPRSPGTGSSDPAPSSGESANFRSLSGSVGELRVLALSTTRPPHSRADTDRRRLGRGSCGGPNRRSRLQGSAPTPIRLLSRWMGSGWLKCSASNSSHRITPRLPTIHSRVPPIKDAGHPTVIDWPRYNAICA